MSGLPPSETGGDQRSEVVALPAVAVTSVGGPGGGAGCGVTTADGAESGPVPAALTAATRNVYPTPSVSPATVKLVAGEPVSTGSCAAEPTYGVMR